METAPVSPLTLWENFYVIVGSSAGALTGLQFVVMTLIADAQTSSSMLVFAPSALRPSYTSAQLSWSRP